MQREHRPRYAVCTFIHRVGSHRGLIISRLLVLQREVNYYAKGSIMATTVRILVMSLGWVLLSTPTGVQGQSTESLARSNHFSWLGPVNPRLIQPIRPMPAARTAPPAGRSPRHLPVMQPSRPASYAISTITGGRIPAPYARYQSSSSNSNSMDRYSVFYDPMHYYGPYGPPAPIQFLTRVYQVATFNPHRYVETTPDLGAIMVRLPAGFSR